MPSRPSLMSSRCRSMRAASLLFGDNAFQPSSCSSLFCKTPSARFSVALMLYNAVSTAETTAASPLSKSVYSLPMMPFPAMRPLGVCRHPPIGLEGSDSSSNLPNRKKSRLRLGCCLKLGDDLSHSLHTPDLNAARLVAEFAAATSPDASAVQTDSSEPNSN